jgi:mannose-6-phosphate isomerase-like protein (cupin superfamily)
MPVHIAAPTRIVAAGNKPKDIDEYVGRVNSKTEAVSIARMRSPSGWLEPGQMPEFDECTLVLRGMLRVEHATGAFEVTAGQAVIARAGEWVRYSSPGPEGAEYVAVCVPAFSPATVHRDAG